MLIDLAEAGAAFLSESPTLQAEVCIVGAGIAGLVLADRLAQSGIDVLLLEAGGLKGAELLRTSGELGGAGVADQGSAEQAHTFGLGGSSQVWGGQLLPARSLRRWPVKAAELAPYLRPTEALLGVDALPYGANEFFRELQSSGLGDLTCMEGLSPRLSKFAPFARRNLASSLGGKLQKHPRVRVLLHAPAEEVMLGANGQCAEAISVRTQRGTLRVAARQVVLAAGTLETVRLLSRSQSTVAAGVGNQHGQLGQGFHDHLTLEAATWHTAAKTRVPHSLRPWIVGGTAGTLHALKLESTEALEEQLGIEPAVAHLVWEEPANSGVEAIRTLLRGRQSRRDSRATALLRQSPRIAGDLLRLYSEAELQGRRYVSPQARAALRINLAQRASSLGRLAFSTQEDHHTDACWQATPEDLRAIRAFAAHLQSVFARCGVEWKRDLRWHPEVLPSSADGKFDESSRPGLESARHTMGGAVMGTDPRRSVTDPELRVHGVANLWVASAATFPDGEPHLPTLTLMQLTLRLADRLMVELRGPQP